MGTTQSSTESTKWYTDNEEDRNEDVTTNRSRLRRTPRARFRMDNQNRSVESDIEEQSIAHDTSDTLPALVTRNRSQLRTASQARFRMDNQNRSTESDIEEQNITLDSADILPALSTATRSNQNRYETNNEEFIEAGTPTVLLRQERAVPAEQRQVESDIEEQSIAHDTSDTLPALVTRNRSQLRARFRMINQNLSTESDIEEQNITLDSADILPALSTATRSNQNRSETNNEEFIEAGTPTVLLRQERAVPAEQRQEYLQHRQESGVVQPILIDDLMEHVPVPTENNDDFEDLDEDIQTALSLVKSAIPEGEDNIRVLKVSRDSIVQDVLAFYNDDDILSKRLVVHFRGEFGADFGGLTTDMFSSFWKEAFVEFFKGEDAVVPSLPIHKRSEATIIYPVLGKILSHMLMLIGELPPKLCRSSLCSTLCPTFEVKDEMLIEDFLLFVSQSERMTLKKALSNEPLSEESQGHLFEIFSSYGMHVLPSKINIENQILDIARSELLDKPLYLSIQLKRGVSSFCMDNFFGRLSPNQLTTFYKTLLPTVSKVVKCIQPEDEYLRPLEDLSLHYLKSLVREMSQETLERFLLFVTGSTLMPLRGIKVSFNTSSGIIRGPVAHTCGKVLELPVSYNSYQDFKKEWHSILSNSDSFKMSVM